MWNQFLPAVVISRLGTLTSCFIFINLTFLYKLEETKIYSFWEFSKIKYCGWNTPGT